MMKYGCNYTKGKENLKTASSMVITYGIENIEMTDGNHLYQPYLGNFL